MDVALSILFETIRKHLIMQPVDGIVPMTGCLVSFESGYYYDSQCTLRRFVLLLHSFCERYRRERTFQTLVWNETFQLGNYLLAYLFRRHIAFQQVV